MFPKGFKAGGVRCGLHKKEGKKDLALFISCVPASAAGMFTKSVTKAAPVIVDIEKMKKGGRISAIIVNSGCANACTGIKGRTDALTVCSEIEKEFNLSKNSVLCASTGVIGQHLNMDAFRSGIKKLKNAVGTSKKNKDDSVSAIMTTDTFIKTAFKKVKTAGGEISVWGCAKGAGMIHPNMRGLHATMLSFILTDAEIEAETLQKLLESSADKSYNCVSVDGDTSTNDTLIILANGQSKTKKLSRADLKEFSTALDAVTLSLAKQIAKDGEGATKFIEIEVCNAKTKNNAKAIASTVAISPLFKTAIFGADANWGRVAAAVGRSGVNFNPQKMDIYMCGILTSKNGMAVNFSESKAKKALLKKEIKIVIDLKAGKESSKYYTCDFSYDYVKINGDYRS
ncbi:MAG: bifunctional glutamate N-acetyltransferase/amino-acid acetyltransferase ArgJ [Endomicrobium sp.]|jgi:glutamate N-acetyltransferase/amino-acid N-acetyltransferase|nr:bifunctional glutamate N-acetyltransferase/amino-acid acetyltransferase ArgJ [Endomicrobium sp.]